MTRLAWVTSVSCILAFVMTSLVVTARLSLLWLLRLYKYEQIHPATWYTVVLTLLVVPHLSQLIYILWNTPILSSANRPKSPVCWNIALGMLSSLLEGVAMAVFAAEVTPVLPEPVLLTLPYAVLASSVITDVFVTHDQPTGKEKGANPCRSSTPIRLALGVYMFFTPLVIGVLLHTGSHFRLDLTELCGLITSLMILSGVWNPHIQKAITRSKMSKVKCPMVEIVYTTIKIISVTSALYLCLYCKYGEMRHSAVEFLGNASGEMNNVFVIAPVVVCLLSGLFGIMTAAASTKLGLIAAGMKIPFFITPLLVVACAVSVWHDIQTDAFWELSGDDLASWFTIVISMFLWIIPFFFPALKLLKSPVRNGKSFTESFISFSWDVFFLEPRTIINYVSDSSTDQIGLSRYHGVFDRKEFETSKSKTKTIFLCTTMYKENQGEMERYVTSIKDTFDNLQDSNLIVEAHVLFDRAIDNGKLNVKARQLIFLICDKFELTYNRLTTAATPYGYQINSGKLLNHSIFIHFKDTNLVKNKKRWSQVMYLNYILQFRCGYECDVDIVNNSNFNKKSEMHLKENNEHDQLEKNIFEKHESCGSDGNNIIIPENGGYNRCSLSEIELFQMEAEYARIKRKMSDSVEGDVYTPDKTTVLCANSCRDSLSWSDVVLQPIHLSPVLDSTTTADAKYFNSDDRLIKPSCRNNIAIGVKHGKLCTRDDVMTKDTFDAEASSSNKKMTSHDHIPKRSQTCLDDVFVLATDADTAFDARSVTEVLNHCQSSPYLGAVCGRTEPIGSQKPIVWYQKFEYAKDFWLVKASQNVIGSVTCCPGCFSLYRGSALAHVFREFSQPSTSGFDSLVKDHGEDRWLCTLLMQKGWRLAYTAHAQNSTHCPETVGEFLRQRRRWVLSEISNMLSIFISVPQLVQNNTSFSGMFLLSLFMTFLWIILSPSTTLVFLCAGGHVLFSVPLTFTLPFAAILFLTYVAVCCFLSQSRQKVASLFITVSMATVVLVLSAGFIVYVVEAMQKDLGTSESVEFRPYFLVFLLILATIYAAVLHPKESLSLVYGLCYALLFPAIFVVLPVYSLTNMVDQSWGTREPGSHSCCQKTEEDVDENLYEDFQINTTDHTSTTKDLIKSEETQFWASLKANVIGCDVNIGKSEEDISRNLAKLRQTSVILLLIANCVWFVLLSVLYVYAGSDVICYCVASVFSFSLVLQLVGLTCHRIDSLITRYLRAHDVKKLNIDFNS